MQQDRLIRKCQKLKEYSWFLFFLVSLFFISCQQEKEPGKHPVEFYHWKTTFQPTSVERDYFESLKSKKVYLRFFDVDKENGVIYPKAVIQPFFSVSLLPAEYIPVLFITNRTLQNLNQKEMEDVVKKIVRLIKEIERDNKLPASEEIQIDCDWTESTRDSYFRLLELLEKESKRTITCTLRLHQIKYFQKTGVPPVSKGYLMCYATSDPSEKSTQNSILDLDLLKNYTANVGQYPLDFDVALPLYSWGVVTNHLGEIRLINRVSEEDMNPDDFIHLSDNLYGVKNDMFFRGLYINKGFTIRVEGISPELLREAKTYLDAKIKKDYAIVYYHLDESFLKKFTIKELQ